MSLTIYIARHGQDEDNANGILNGQRDMPLTKLGRQQAVDLGKEIIKDGITIDTVYASPLIRAKDTAKIVLDEIGLEKTPIILPKLIERDYGVMTGRSVAEREAMRGPTVIRSAAGIYKLDQEGAETFPKLFARAQHALSNIKSRHAEGGFVLIVCHGEIGKMIYAAGKGISWRMALEEFYFANGKIVQVVTT